ncbi:Glutamine synthetase [Vitis vinifera]|uniref:Glutamine synthetase n=1 Tax=Vitis vinifera TaxID=29760 RepID=A0A438HY70_VITVI|nr:Glutamine synthetase [Vitis vinifera]
MRNTTGYDVILKAIENLVLPHKDHIAAYGEGNERRLTGHHEMKRLTSTLSVGGASVRVGHDHPEKKEKDNGECRVKRDGYKLEFDTRT